MTILRTSNFSTVRDLACTLNDIYSLKHCSYGVDFSLMTLGLRFEYRSWPQECLATGEILLPH